MPHAVEGRAIAKPRLGFLGVGLIGYRRLESVVRSGVGEIVAITDTSPRAVERALTLVPTALGCTSLEAMQAAGLDGVVIATPSAQHASESILALRSGLAVFCQKPLGRNAAEVGQIIEAARSHGKLLEVDLCYRYTEAMQKIRPLIRSGALGHIFAVDLTYHNTSGPQSPWFFDPTLSGGGCVLDLGIHLVDAVLWVLDRPIVSVASRLYHRGRRIHGQMDVAEDYATARLDVAGDTVVNLCCSWRLHAGRAA